MAEQKEILESIRDVLAGKPGEVKNDDDILDLTSKLNDDGSVTEIIPKHKREEVKVETKPEPTTAAPKPAAPKPASSGDILSDIDALLDANKTEAPIPAPIVKDEKVELEFTQKPEPEEIEEETKSEEKGTTMAEDTATSGFEPLGPRDENDSLISEVSAMATKGAISELMGKIKKGGKEANKVEASAPFRSGATVEDLVIEMLKPMMKDWLDKNLPILVNEIVQKEIQKLIPKD